jgi:2-polyprenyl-3-methyl-5-hydroxy-6-metoxy-1,4-benzoquinol methylase
MHGKWPRESRLCTRRSRGADGPIERAGSRRRRSVLRRVHRVRAHNVLFVEVSKAPEYDPGAYWEDRLERFDLAAVGYRALGLPYNAWLYRLRRSVFRSVIEPLADWRGKEVLDIGSGTGFYIEEWMRLGSVVTGSDIAATAVSRLAQRYTDANIIQLDITGGSRSVNRSFDAVSAMDVLFHIVEDDRYAQALGNISRALRPGGLFVFSENFVHQKTVRRSHQVSRRLADIEQLLTEVHLDVLERQPMFVLMNAPLDSTDARLHAYWRGLERLLRRYPQLGSAIGAALYPLERMLVATRRESPTTEIMVCRKSSRL